MFRRFQRDKRAARSGFTLIELTVVMLILAVMFALVLPLANNATPGYRLKSDIRIIASFIDSTHAEAVSSRRPYAVGFDFDERTFWTVIPVERPVDGDPDKTVWVIDVNDRESWTSPETLARGVRFKTVRTADGEEYSAGEQFIEFDAFGNKGSQIVILAVYDEDKELETQAVKYNALTRSLNYGDADMSFYREGG